MKKYYFSVDKHGHDIEFFYNRVRNHIDDMTAGVEQFDPDKLDKLEELSDQVEELLAHMHGTVVQLTGPQIRLAKECVMWAGAMRERA